MALPPLVRVRLQCSCDLPRARLVGRRRLPAVPATGSLRRLSQDQHQYQRRQQHQHRRESPHDAAEPLRSCRESAEKCGSTGVTGRSARAAGHGRFPQQRPDRSCRQRLPARYGRKLAAAQPGHMAATGESRPGSAAGARHAAFRPNRVSATAGHRIMVRRTRDAPATRTGLQCAPAWGAADAELRAPDAPVAVAATLISGRER